MKTKLVRDVVKGDRLATTDPNVDAIVTHSYAAGRGIMRRPTGGGEEEPAWLIVWNWAGDYRPGIRDAEFLAQDDKVQIR